MNLTDDIIKLRIELARLCEGFSSKESSKNAILTNKIKILYLLDEKDLTPNKIIESLSIAKSNLASTFRELICEGLVISYKTEDNHKNINYKITDKGKIELKGYKEKLQNNINCSKLDTIMMSNKIRDIINIIGGNND